MPHQTRLSLLLLIAALDAADPLLADRAARHARRDGRRTAEAVRTVAAVERQGVEGSR